MTRRYRTLAVTLGIAAAVSLAIPAGVHAQYHGPRHVVHVGVGFPYYYPGWYYWGAWGWGWPGYGWWGYPPYPYYYWGYYDRTGAARLDVKPRETQVFVDGYYVGDVDDFDGTFQRLRVEAGEHELSFYLDGYRTERHKVLFRRNGTLNMGFVMQPLGPGESSARPQPDPAAAGRPPVPRGREIDAARPQAGVQEQGRDNEQYGTVVIRVQPGDAEILVDGQRWDGPDGGARLELQLLAGTHRVEIRKDGYRTYIANLRIRPGATEALNVSLNQE